MDLLDPSGWDLPALRDRWRGARPFPHLVLDGLVPEAERPRLRAAFAEEPLVPQADEHFWFRGSNQPPQQPLLRGLVESFARPDVLHAVSFLAGKRLGHADGRAYAYARGCYLLPHSDSRVPGERLVAFAWYLAQDAPLSGGELLLYRCEGSRRGLRSSVPAKRIAPRWGRLVLFAVSPTALHRVCEVTRGERFSLAGWFGR